MGNPSIKLPILLALGTAVASSGPLVAKPMPAADFQIAERIPGADGGWDYASVDTAGNRLRVSRSDGVMTIDLTTHKVTSQFVTGGRVHASFIIPGMTTGVATNGLIPTTVKPDSRGRFPKA